MEGSTKNLRSKKKPYFRVNDCQKRTSCYRDCVAKRLVQHVHTTLHLVGISGASSHVEWIPNTDIYENDNFYTIRMELAGVDRDEIQIQISDRTLIVRGRRTDPCRLQKCSFKQMEINYGAFERHLAVPRNVDTQNVKANHRNGFLVIELPKTRSNHPPVKVNIKHS